MLPLQLKSNLFSRILPDVFPCGQKPLYRPVAALTGQSVSFTPAASVAEKEKAGFLALPSVILCRLGDAQALAGGESTVEHLPGSVMPWK